MTLLLLPASRFMPRPIIARTEAEILSARGVKPVLSPNLEVLAAVEAAGTTSGLLLSSTSHDGNSSG